MPRSAKNRNLPGGTTLPGFDSPFFSAIVIFKNQPFSTVFGGFLERRIPGKNGEVTPRTLLKGASWQVVGFLPELLVFLCFLVFLSVVWALQNWFRWELGQFHTFGGYLTIRDCPKKADPDKPRDCP